MEQEYRQADDGRAEHAACAFALVLSAVLSVVGAVLAAVDYARGGGEALSYAALAVAGIPCMLAMAFALLYLRRRRARNRAEQAAGPAGGYDAAACGEEV